jgi:hypothetical protein
LINRLTVTFSIIAVTETWENPNNESYFHIPNYCYVDKPCTNTHGGGVALYIRDNIAFKVREGLDVLCNDQFEFLTVCLNLDGKSKNITVVYRFLAKVFQILWNITVNSATRLLQTNVKII